MTLRNNAEHYARQIEAHARFVDSGELKPESVRQWWESNRPRVETTIRDLYQTIPPEGHERVLAMGDLSIRQSMLLGHVADPLQDETMAMHLLDIAVGIKKLIDRLPRPDED